MKSIAELKLDKQELKNKIVNAIDEFLQSNPGCSLTIKVEKVSYPLNMAGCLEVTEVVSYQVSVSVNL